MRIFSFILIGFILPTFVFSNDLNAINALTNTKWKITEINKKVYPDDAVDLVFILKKNGELDSNIFDEISPKKDKKFYKVVNLKSKWFVENKKIVLLETFETQAVNLNNAPPEIRNIKNTSVCRVEIISNLDNIAEVNSFKGQMHIYYEIKGNLNGYSLDRTIDLGPIVTGLVFGNKRFEDLGEMDPTKPIKPLEILMEKMKQ